MSSPAGPPASGVNISSLADGVYFGILLSTALWGITIVQTWTYTNTNKDGWMIRTLVGVLFVLDTVTTALTTEMGHFYLLQNFGDVANLNILPPSAFAEVCINVIIVFLVECFFAYRVFLLSGGSNYVVPALITIFAVAALVAGMWIIADISQFGTVTHLSSRSMKYEVALTNAFSAASDVVATIAMSLQLFQGRNGLRRTDTLLERLMAYIVARGGMVTVAQILTLILYVSNPTSLNWMPVHFCLCKLYVITMVVILNSRRNLREQFGTHVHSTTAPRYDSSTRQTRMTFGTMTTSQSDSISTREGARDSREYDIRRMSESVSRGVGSMGTVPEEVFKLDELSSSRDTTAVSTPSTLLEKRKMNPDV